MGCANDGCTLEAAELIERVGAWREVSSRALSRAVEGGRITSVYPKDEQLLTRLRGLIAKEASCCAFLRFTVHEREDHTVVELSFPEEARILVETVITPS